MKILYSKGDHDLLFNLNLASVVMRFVVDVFPFKITKDKIRWFRRTRVNEHLFQKLWSTKFCGLVKKSLSQNFEIVFQGLDCLNLMSSKEPIYAHELIFI